ncbi:sensor domain-containing protein [Mycobacterium sp. 2YAF39]|uniref:sensor domain-containing protein n=1 Tax=Mycobacterium sp. 2YAF39 TaxID=3233033 RepID=UPI003F976A5A
MVSDNELGGLLLDVADIDAIMGTSTMRTHPPVTQMGDHRNLLPNLNCLGVWQVDEAPIYDPSHWKSVRQQMLRTPDTDPWNSLVVQSVVSYRITDGPRLFLDDSADRWAQCTNHNVNIQLNNQRLPAWKSGNLTRTEDRLAMPYSRGSGADTRSCQHVLQAAANVIIDVVACGPQAQSFTRAADVATAIEAKMPR